MDGFLKCEVPNCEDLGKNHAAVLALQEEELNQIFATAGLRQITRFTTPQLAMFSSSLARLPSTGREAFLSVVALRILPQALRSCNFVDLGLILQAMSSCDVTLTRDVISIFHQRLAEVAKEELAELAATKQTGVAAHEAKLNSTAAALERISEASLKVFIGIEGFNGKALLAAIRPLTLELFTSKALRLRTTAALLSMYAHFRIQDSELLKALNPSESETISPVLAGRLLRGMAPLGLPPVKSVMLLIDQSFASSRGTWQRSLPALAADLFAAALLDFAHLSENAVNSLLQAAKRHCELGESSTGLDSALRLKCASEISAASHAWLRHEAMN